MLSSCSNDLHLQETTDPGVMLDGGGLMPLGGNELSGRLLAIPLFISV